MSEAVVDETVHARAQGTKVKDPRWLRVDICRDFTAGKCKRSEFQCRFAHPTRDCVSENSKVIVCYDSMKGKCCRESCKFYHPPFHIKEHLLAFGKYLQQQRLERDRAIESTPSSPGVVASSSVVSVSTANDTTSGGSNEGECGQYTGDETTCSDTTPRRHSDRVGYYSYNTQPVYMCEDNMGSVFYSAVPSAGIPAWSLPQQIYYQPIQRPVVGSTAFICQGYPAMTIPVLDQVPCNSQPFYPMQYGRDNIAYNNMQYYPLSPQVVMVANPQTEIVNPSWSPGQRQFFMTPGYSSGGNRPNSI